jgi:hypothetical protein
MLHPAVPVAAVALERDRLHFRGPHKEEIELAMAHAPYVYDFAQGPDVRQRRRGSGIAAAAGVA